MTTTSPSDLAPPRSELDLFLGSGTWTEVTDSDREGLRCAKQEQGQAALRAYFDAGGSLKAMAVTIAGETIEMAADKVLAMAAAVQQQHSAIRGRPMSSMKRR